MELLESRDCPSQIFEIFHLARVGGQFLLTGTDAAGHVLDQNLVTPGIPGPGAILPLPAGFLPHDTAAVAAVLMSYHSGNPITPVFVNPLAPPIPVNLQFPGVTWATAPVQLDPAAGHFGWGEQVAAFSAVTGMELYAWDVPDSMVWVI